MKKFIFVLAFLASLSLLGCAETSSSSVSSSVWSLTSYPDSGIYPILIYVPTGHGNLSSSKGESKAGLTITIAVTAEPGYVLEKIRSEDAVLTEEVPFASYSFVMPAKSVTVTASFILDSASSFAL